MLGVVSVKVKFGLWLLFRIRMLESMSLIQSRQEKEVNPGGFQVKSVKLLVVYAL